MENSTKKKWLWGIGIFLVLAAIGSMQENKEENSESATPQQTERVAEQPQEIAWAPEQPQETEAERLAREKQEEAEQQAREQKEKQAKKDKILKEGYDRGYNDAIQYTYYQEMNYRIPYTNLYGAPKSDEEIALYKQYKEQYDKGWSEGRKIKEKMNEL